MKKTPSTYVAYSADGDCLYVGATDYPKGRTSQHKIKAAWFPDAARWVWTDHETPEGARLHEADLIRTLNPIHNKVRFHMSSPVTRDDKGPKQQLLELVRPEVATIVATGRAAGKSWAEIAAEIRALESQIQEWMKGLGL